MGAHGPSLYRCRDLSFSPSTGDAQALALAFPMDLPTNSWEGSHQIIQKPVALMGKWGSLGILPSPCTHLISTTHFAWCLGPVSHVSEMLVAMWAAACFQAVGTPHYCCTGHLQYQRVLQQALQDLEKPTQKRNDAHVTDGKIPTGSDRARPRPLCFPRLMRILHSEFQMIVYFWLTCLAWTVLCFWLLDLFLIYSISTQM